MPNPQPVHPPLEASRWRVSRRWERLDQLCDGIFDCPHSTPVLVPHGPFVVRSQDVRSGVFRMGEAGCVSEETYQERIARAEPRFGDLLYSREGTYFGIAAEVPPGTRVCLGQRMVLIRPSASRLNSRFLRLWLNSSTLSRHVHGFRDGTVAERLNMPTIRALPIPVFDRDEQDAIANVLGSLDDKIELKRRMNETLETMAQVLFKDWFVEFGPVYAKVEGGQPRQLSSDVAAMFPNKIDGDGKPMGWHAGPVEHFFEVNPSELLPKGQDAPYLDMAALSVSGSWTENPVMRAASSGSRFRNGDTVLARITPCLENGKTAFIQCLPEGVVGWGSTEFIVIRSKPPLPAPCSYLLARDESFRTTAIQSMTGTSGRQRVRNEAVESYQVCFGSAEVMTAFGQIISPWFQAIAANVRQSLILTELRDLLLPKLMSGALQVQQAEEALEAVA